MVIAFNRDEFFSWQSLLTQALLCVRIEHASFFNERTFDRG